MWKARIWNPINAYKMKSAIPSSLLSTQKSTHQQLEEQLKN